MVGDREYARLVPCIKIVLTIGNNHSPENWWYPWWIILGNRYFYGLLTHPSNLICCFSSLPILLCSPFRVSFEFQHNGVSESHLSSSTMVLRIASNAAQLVFGRLEVGFRLDTLGAHCCNISDVLMKYTRIMVEHLQYRCCNIYKHNTCNMRLKQL